MANHLPPSLPATPTDWRALLARQEHSGLSARAFCARHEIPYQRFMYWRRKLSTASQGEPGLPGRQQGSNATPEAIGPTFIEVLKASAGKADPGWELELQLGSGLTLRLRSV